MDSKEEILDKYGMGKNDLCRPIPSVLSAMDDFAKEVAIDFCEWRKKQTLRFLRDEAGMFQGPKYTLEDEFNKYLQSKQ